MKKIITLLMMLFITTLLFSQNDTTCIQIQKQEPYFPDRPGMSANARLVGLHSTDYETSFGYTTNYNLNTFYNTNLIRFGLYKFLELRIGMDFGYLPKEDPEIIGLKALSFGVKIPIVKDLKWLPDIAILGQVYLPDIGKPVFATPLYAPQATLLLQKGWGNYLLIGNVGFFYDGYNPYAQGMYSLAFLYSFSPKLGVFIESYTFFSGKTEPVYFGDMGLSYFLNKNLEIDMSFGNKYVLDFKDPQLLFVYNPFYINCGLAWKIPHKCN